MSWRVERAHRDLPALLWPARALGGLVLLQLLLGLGSYVSRFADVILSPSLILALPVVHRLTGALLLGVSLLLTFRCYRLLEPPVLSAERLLSGEVPA